VRGRPCVGHCNTYIGISIECISEVIMRFDSFVHAVTDDQVLSFAGFASTSVRKPYRRFFANWGLAFFF
jgi:hypothetical protein